MTDKASDTSGTPIVALAVGRDRAYAVGPGLREAWPRAELPARFSEATRRLAPRWVVWSASLALRDVVTAGVAVTRTWDLAEVHRLIHGGWWASPGHVVAGCGGLPESDVPQPPPAHRAGFDGDLFEAASAGESTLLTAEGHLRADALTGWATDDDRLEQLCRLALDCQRQQEATLRGLTGAEGGVSQTTERLVRTAWSESAAAVLCLELERDGLPVDRLAVEDLISASAGARPRDDAEAAATRAQRDRAVLAHAPGRERTDLRNPAQVRDLLASVGVQVPNTRAWVLEPYRETNALVDALLTWRKDERIATTYGYRWLDDNVGSDDRLRGAWTASDGAAGRMTAQNGLHNLPAPLRPAICAEPGHVFVRADLGQIEPRVLAVVSADRAFAEATRSDDLYAPVAAKLGADRPKAKVAVLAAMYGQRSGAAGETLKDLERAYPVAMGLLDRAYADGVARRPVRTYGGRLIRLGTNDPQSEPGGIRSSSPEADAARGRFARNAIIQGSAAELFKAWAATVRHAVRPLGGQIVLCLHDELLVHVPQEQAASAQRAVEDALDVAAVTWAGTDRVRFVADSSIIRRWSEAKG